MFLGPRARITLTFWLRQSYPYPAPYTFNLVIDPGILQDIILNISVLLLLIYQLYTFGPVECL